MIENDVMNLIRSRRSIRKFKEGQIASSELETILEAAIWAPSGSNSQSWLFTAIQDKGALLELNRLVKEGFQTWVPDDDYPGKLGIKEYSKSESFNFYHEAPTLIISSNAPNYENAMADCAMALQNMFLAAESIGVGGCYINQLHWLRHDEAVRRFLGELGIPIEHTVCNSAAFGYFDKKPLAPPRKEGTINIIR